VDSPTETLALARQYQQAGYLQYAEQLYQQVLQADPWNVEALQRLGGVYLATGHFQEAAANYQHLLGMRPDIPEAYNNLAIAYLEMGRPHDAIATFERALQVRPDFAEAHDNLGVVLAKLGRLEEAVAHHRQAVAFKPDMVAAYSNLSVALTDLRRPVEAETSARQALALRPDYAEAYSNLGNALRDQNRFAEAESCYLYALQLKPDCADAHNNLAVEWVRQGRLDEALSHYHEALRLKPGFAAALSNLGVVYARLGQYADAETAYRQALQLGTRDAETHSNLGLLLLTLGRFGEGWPEFEYRWQVMKPRRPPFPQPRWDGSPLAGRTILLHAEQGLGDTLHFIRYAPLVQARGGRVVVECQPSLVRIVATCPGIDELVAEGSPSPLFDVQVPLMSLPGIFRTDLSSIPASVPYLRADDRLVQRWRDELASLCGFKIGIAWQGNPDHPLDRYRSLPLCHFEPLARIPGVQLVSLQRGPGKEQLSEVANRFPVLDVGGRLEAENAGFEETAAVIQNLNLVISADTAVAHLAGALAARVWLALSYVPEWRWLLERDDSPWYPTLRLFRQKEMGNWESVFSRMAEQVTLLLRSRRGG
jgi:Flp pilus assembly protein TadD